MGKPELETNRCRWEDIKIILKRDRVGCYGLNKMLGDSWVVEQLVVSQEGLR
jgi:hypothetical protein